jgi:hypothetical protein
VNCITHRLLLEVPERVLLGHNCDGAHAVDAEVLGEGLAAEHAQAAHCVTLRKLQQRDRALKIEI